MTESRCTRAAQGGWKRPASRSPRTFRSKRAVCASRSMVFDAQARRLRVPPKKPATAGRVDGAVVSALHARREAGELFHPRCRRGRCTETSSPGAVADMFLTQLVSELADDDDVAEGGEEEESARRQEAAGETRESESQRTLILRLALKKSLLRATCVSIVGTSAFAFAGTAPIGANPPHWVSSRPSPRSFSRTPAGARQFVAVEP